MTVRHFFHAIAIMSHDWASYCYRIFISVCLSVQCMLSINLSVTLSSQSVLSKCMYDTVVHKLQHSVVM